jgi:hypothetical protein
VLEVSGFGCFRDGRLVRLTLPAVSLLSGVSEARSRADSECMSEWW